MHDFENTKSKSKHPDVHSSRHREDWLTQLNHLTADMLTPGSLDSKMQQISDAIVKIFNADFARVWLIRKGDQCTDGCQHVIAKANTQLCSGKDVCLHLVASSGRYPSINGTHSRVPFGCYKIGRVAASIEPGFLTNDVCNDPRVHNHDWAREIGLQSFAGYKLQSEYGKPVGVLALFSKKILSTTDEYLLQNIAGTASNVIMVTKALDKYKASELKYQSMVENINLGVVLFDNKLQITELNKRTREWFPNIDLKRNPFCTEIFQCVEEQDQCKECPVSKTLHDGKIREKTINVSCDKSNRTFHIVCSPIPGPRNTIHGVIAHVEEITLKLELESQLRQSQKLESIGLLAGGIAHDFNNILSAIIGFTELIQSSIPPDKQLQEDISEIFTASLRAKDLVEQILLFSRNQTTTPQIVFLDTLIKEGARLLRSSLPTSITIKTKIPETLKPVLAHPNQIHQILISLCTNAVESIGKEDGIITIELSCKDVDDSVSKNIHNLHAGSYIILSVHDSGIGIDKESLHLIFDPYYTTKELGDGTGLGLSVTYNIIKELGGAINVESMQGEGSLFSVYLPIAKEEVHYATSPSDSGPPQPKETGSNNEHILIVDCEPAILRVLSRSLIREGFWVTTENNGKDALKIVKENPTYFDLMICEIDIPQIPGDKLAERIYEHAPDLPIILISGYNESFKYETLDNIGIQKVLKKPIKKETLHTAIFQILRTPKTQLLLVQQ